MNKFRAEPSTSYKVIVADSYPLFREALATIIEELWPENSVVEISDHKGLVDALLHASATDEPYSLVLADLELVRNSNSYFDMQSLKKLSDPTPLILISAQEDVMQIQTAFQYGIMGFIFKSFDRNIIKNAISLVASGSAFIPGLAIPQLRTDLEKCYNPPKKLLTHRQHTVLNLISEGKSNKEIANEIHISELTVKSHVSAILKRLGANSRIQAVLIAKSKRAQL